MKTGRFMGPLLLSIMFAGGTGAQMSTKPPVTLHSHGTFHRRGKLKGWMRENKKSTFNKNR